jgi:membrane-associated phospholipid phosphatase
MKKSFIIFLLLTIIFKGNSQSNDSLSTNKDKLSYKKFIAPVALLSTGTLLLGTQINKNLQQDIRNSFGSNFHTKVDNYIQYAPILQIYAGKYLGFQPKNDILHQTINILVANAIMGGVVQIMKHSIKEERPDNTDRLSFPSGHTAITFTNATLLYYEYKDSNLWYASSGFLFATATGMLRIANNKHRTSDVLAGAGIGMAAGLLVSYWHPFQSLSLGKNKKTTGFIYPQLGNQIGIGLLIRSN